ncbi:hypothetical protein [Kibdelosporangium aridum]|uniref:hypothetical protein n=1 Tax=Kibdelosporangium aridum TaxID=2030 RepID=UPI0035EA55A2
MIPEWDNTFNPTSWDKWLEYDAQASASQLKQPLLVIHSEVRSRLTGSRVGGWR